jgi:hypothetical protein
MVPRNAFDRSKIVNFLLLLPSVFITQSPSSFPIESKYAMRLLSGDHLGLDACPSAAVNETGLPPRVGSTHIDE